MSENTEKKEVKKQTDLDLLNKMKALPGGLGERKIFCVYGKNSSLIRNRYV